MQPEPTMWGGKTFSRSDHETNCRREKGHQCQTICRFGVKEFQPSTAETAFSISIDAIDSESMIGCIIYGENLLKGDDYYYYYYYLWNYLFLNFYMIFLINIFKFDPSLIISLVFFSYF